MKVVHENKNTVNHTAFAFSTLQSFDLTISNNIFSNNELGVFLLMTYRTQIIENIFNENQLHATYFYDRFSLESENHWNGNYWGRPRLIPKIIPGLQLIILPSIQIDFQPEKNIEGTT